MEMKVVAGSGRGGPRPRLDVSAIKVVPMLEDHKPNLPGERACVKSTGLTVQINVVRPPDVDNPMDGGGEPPTTRTTVVPRVRKSKSNLLGVSRTFGDYGYKLNAKLSPSRKAVVCMPNIAARECAQNEDMYLILVCNGQWDMGRDVLTTWANLWQGTSRKCGV